MTIPSPCTNLCRMDARRGHCAGCYRSLDEIATWAQADAPTRLAILTRASARRQSDAAQREVGHD